MAYQLGVDLGTTFTAAAIARDGHVEMATLGDRAAAIPSVLFLRADGGYLVGDAAVRRGLTEPDRLAREFKRRLGDPAPLLLGGTPVAADALFGTLLRWVVDRVAEREGEQPAHVTVTRPANWGPYKQELLDGAIARAGLRDMASTVTEPEAAAIHYASTERLESGGIVAVYDLGGGTFDAAVLRKTDSGFDVLGQPEGLERTGGIDFDEAVFAHVASVLGGALADLDTDDASTLAAVARLRDDCVAAKEGLSSDTDVAVPVLLPTVQTEVRLTRAEFEAMIRPTLTDTVSALDRALQSAGVTGDDVRAVVLVGGSSRIPLVGELLSREMNRPVAVDIHPKHAVALGAARSAARVMGAPEPLAPVAPAPPPPPTPAAPTPPASAAPAPGSAVAEAEPLAQQPTKNRSRLMLGAVAAVVVIGAVVAALVLTRHKGSSSSSSGPSADDAPLTLPVDRVAVVNTVVGDGSGKDWKLATFEVPTTPSDVAFGAGSAWILTTDGSRVTRIDPATNQTTAIVRVGRQPRRVVFGSGSVWTSDQSSKTVTRVDPATNAIAASIDVGAEPAGLAVTDTAVWVSRNDGKVIRIDPATNTVALTLDVGGSEADLAEADGFVWVSNAAIPGVLRIDESTGHVGNVIRTGSAPGRLTVGAGSVWVEDESDHTITRIDAKAESVVTTIPVNEEIRGMVVAGNDLWASLPTPNQLARIDVTTNILAGKITVGISPSGLTTSADNVWVCDSDERKVTRVSA